VFAAQVAGAPIADSYTFGNYAVAYDNVTTGAYTAVEEDMTVDFGTTPGARDIGSTRVRWKAADATYLYFTETAAGKLPIVDNCYMTVVEEFRPWMVLPRGVGVQNGVPYTNDITMYVDYDHGFVEADSPNIFFRPKVNITRSATSYLAPKPAGFVDGYKTGSEQTYRAMVLSSWLSFDFSAGGGIGSVLWDVGDGTITVGTSASATITVRFPVGFRYIRCTVTSVNGQSRTMRYPIWVHNDTYMPLTRFDYSQNVTNDWREMDLEFYAQDTSETTIPRGTALCYWKVPRFTPIPEAYRDQALGWAREDTTLFRKYQSRNTITLMGLGGWLEFLRSFPIRVYDPDPAAVDTWFEMYAITLNRLNFYVLEYFTNATRIANFYPSSDDTELKSLDITGETIWQQLKYINNGNQHLIRSSSLNELWVRKHYSFMTTSERAAVTPLLELTDADWEHRDPPKIMRRDDEPVGYVVGTGAALNTSTNENTLYKAGAPGRTPADGAITKEAPFQNLNYATAQDDLNWLTGQFLAHENNERANVPFNLIYPLDCVEPAWGLPIMASTTNADSGLELDEDLFLVKELNLSYVNGEARERVVYATEGVTQGAAGEMLPVLVDEYVPDDELPPTDIVLPPISGPDDRMPAYDGDTLPTRIFVLDAGGAHASIATAWSPISSSLVYTDISTGLTGYGIWACSDPFDYRRRFALMSTGLYVCNNIWGSSPTWSLVASSTTLFGNSSRIGHWVGMSINRRGYIAINSGTNVFVYTTNYGASWNTVTVDGGSPEYYTGFPTNTSRLSVAISTHNSNGSGEGVIYASSGTMYFAINNWRLRKSTDWGATWTVVSDKGDWSSMDGVNPVLVHLPHTRADGSPNLNDSNQELYIVVADRIGRSTNGGVTGTTPIHNELVETSRTGYSIMTFTHDGGKFITASGHLGSGALIYDNISTLIDSERILEPLPGLACLVSCKWGCNRCTH